MESKSIKPILLISPLPPPFGGIATWTQLFCKYGLSAGEPIHLINTKLRGGRNIFTKATLSFAEIYRNLNVICSLIYHILFRRPKIIHLNCSLSPVGVTRDLLCVYIANVFYVPIVTQYHGNLPDFNFKKLFGLSGNALRLLFKNSRLNILTNEQSLQFAELIDEGTNKILLANFIEDEIFNYQNTYLHNERTNIIFAGGITKAKGAQEIFELAMLQPTVDFHLYGKLHADMQEQYQQTPANLILHGEVAHQELILAMKKSDVLLFPSHTEGFPLTVLEAMAVGLPIIATKVGAIGEMIDADGGYLAAAGDLDALQLAVNTLANDANKRKKMGEYNRHKSFNEYRYSVISAKLEKIYGDVLCAE